MPSSTSQPMGDHRVVAITIPFPGAKRPLEEGAKLGWWELVLLGEQEALIPPADIYILGAWHPVYEQVLNILNPASKIIVLWTSSIGEVDFTPVEQEYLPSLLEDSRIDGIWFGDGGLAEVYPEKGFHAVYPFAVDQFERKEVTKVTKTDTISLFCPTGPKKNILNILYGVAIAQRLIGPRLRAGLRLNTNIKGYDFLFDVGGLLRKGTQRFQWLREDEYHQLIAAARLNMAVSHCETYNYQAAEALMNGTASVVSCTVPIPGWRVENPNSAQEIGDVIAEAFEASMRPPGYTAEPFRTAFIDMSRASNKETLQKLQDEFAQLMER